MRQSRVAFHEAYVEALERSRHQTVIAVEIHAVFPCGRAGFMAKSRRDVDSNCPTVSQRKLAMVVARFVVWRV
jgi:hypothetical protein